MEQRTAEPNRSAPATVALVVIAITLNAATFVLPNMNASGPESYVTTLSLCVTLVAACMLSWKLFKHGVAASQLTRVYLASSITYLATCVIGLHVASNVILGALMGVALGVARTYALALVGCLAGSLGFRQSQNAVLVSFTVAVAYCLVCYAVASTVLGIATTVVCIASMTGCVARLNTFEGICDPQVPVVSPTTPNMVQTVRMLFESPSVTAITYIATLLFLFLFGLIGYACEKGGLASGVSPWVMALALCCLALAACPLKSVSVYLNALFFALYLATVLTAAFVAFTSTGTAVLYAVALSGTVFMQVIIQVFALATARRYGIPIAWMFTVLLGALVLAHSAGRLIAWALLTLLALETRLVVFAGLTIVALIALIALSAFVLPRSKVPLTSPETWDIPEHAEESEHSRQHATTDNQVWDNAFEQLAHNLALSEKETEIMRPYLQGRSVPVISSRLHLAESTVRMYIGNVYTRANVHGKQELMNLLDEFASGVGTCVDATQV